MGISLPDEKANTAMGFMHRARAWFAAHGINHAERIVTDNGACYRAREFAHFALLLASSLGLGGMGPGLLRVLALIDRGRAGRRRPEQSPTSAARRGPGL